MCAVNGFHLFLFELFVWIALPGQGSSSKQPAKVGSFSFLQNNSTTELWITNWIDGGELGWMNVSKEQRPR